MHPVLVKPAFICCIVIGKAEGNSLEWHGHVTALTVAPEYRRLGLARKMMNLLEMVSDESYKAFFVDLYVRCANLVAIDMYEGLGYSVYRRVREYYGNLGVGKGGRDEEDAFGTFYSHYRFGERLTTIHRYEKTPLPRPTPTIGAG
jgi:ribosomal protein S18 acetylase RimI-like enzyme